MSKNNVWLCMKIPRLAMFEPGTPSRLGFYFGRMGTGIATKYARDLESFTGPIARRSVPKSTALVCYRLFLGALPGKLPSMG